MSLGKLWPLAIIWVPITTSTSWARIERTISAAWAGLPTVSPETTMKRASGSSIATSSATRSTPGPQALKLSAVPQSGQIDGRGASKPQ